MCVFERPQMIGSLVYPKPTNGLAAANRPKDQAERNAPKLHRLGPPSNGQIPRIYPWIAVLERPIT
jgi:hypothetical protein